MTFTLDPLLLLVLVGLVIFTARKLVKLALFVALVVVILRFVA